MRQPRTFLLASLAFGLTAGISAAQTVVSGAATGPVTPPTLVRPTNFPSAVNGLYGVGSQVGPGAPSGNCTDFELQAPCLFSQTNPLTNQIANFVASGPAPGDGGAVLDTCANFMIQPRSGVNFLAFNVSSTMANGGTPLDPETITFNSPVSSVEIWGSGGAFFPNAVFKMDAFNGAVLVDSDTVNGSSTWERVSVSAASITHIVLTEISGTPAWVYDDMCWSGGGPGTIGQNFQCPATVPNSSGQGGVITATGSDVAANNDVKLTASQLPNSQFGSFLNSPFQNPVGFIPSASQGPLCIGPQSIGRYNQPGSIFNTMGTGMGMLQLDLPNTPTSTGNQAIVAGQTWYFTCWFRDNNPGTTSNFTDAVCITFQ